MGETEPLDDLYENHNKQLSFGDAIDNENENDVEEDTSRRYWLEGDPSCWTINMTIRPNRALSSQPLP